jgi:hypothetical protein
MGSNPSSPTSEENSFASSLRRSSHTSNHLGRTHSQRSAGTPAGLPDTPSTPHLGFQFGGGSSGALTAGNGANRRGSSGAIIGGEAEQFWVPPTVLHKKRAQSLIPHVLDHGE